MKNKHFLFYCFIISLCSCNNRDQNRQIIGKDKTGKIVTNYSVNKFDQKEGVFQSFYINGKVHQQYNYKRNKLNGVQKEFYENGNLKMFAYFRDGKLDSLQKAYFENGSIMYENFRLDKKLFGMQKEYSENGKLKSSYFMSIDSSMISSFDLDTAGKIIKKTGSFIYCVYDKNTLHKQDSIGAVFYIYYPPLYECSCEVIERKKYINIKRTPCEIFTVNNNKAVLIQRNFEKAGDYDIGVYIKLNNEKFQSLFYDSMFLKVKVW